MHVLNTIRKIRLISLAIVLLTTGVAVQKTYAQTAQSTTTTTITSTATKGILSNKANTFVYVDQMPSPPYNVNAFIAEHLKYPDSARAQGKEGRVVVEFVIDTLGNVIEPEIFKSPDTSLSRAAIEMVRQLPPWKPGSEEGKKVRVILNLPVLFKLN